MTLNDQQSKAVLDVPDMGADRPEGIQVQALFDKQKAYFATDVTKTYEWRMDQLDRLIRMLKENYQRFADASRMDFKTACRTELLADRITQSAAF